MNKKNLLMIASCTLLLWACQTDKKEDAKEFYSDLFDKQEESAEFALTDEEISGEMEKPKSSELTTEVKAVQPETAAVKEVTPQVVETPKVVEAPKVEQVTEPVVSTPAPEVVTTPTVESVAQVNVESKPQEKEVSSSN